MSESSDRPNDTTPTTPLPAGFADLTRPTPQPVRPTLDAHLDAEIEAALGDMSLDDLMDMSSRPKPTTRKGKGEREYKTGTVVRVHNGMVYVEFGPKSQGMCPAQFFETLPEPGARLEFIVDRYDPKEKILLLAREGAVQKAEWENLEIGQIVEARVTAVNKGGLELEVANHKAFMPAGQVDLRHIGDLSVFIGEKLTCEVIELDRQRARIILSRRNTLEADRVRLREKLLETLEVGQNLPAVIVSVQSFGAFADLGGMDGLIHVSDLSYERVKHPSEVVKEGQQVEVRVLKIDRSVDPPKLSLGLKQNMTDPYQAKAGELKEGTTITGRVTKIMPFGAFVEIAPGIEGLVHISELSHDRVQNVSQVVKANEIVNAQILSIDSENRRISLSIKALRAKQEENMDRGEDPEMRRLKAQLQKKFGNLKGGIG